MGQDSLMGITGYRLSPDRTYPGFHRTGQSNSPNTESDIAGPGIGFYRTDHHQVDLDNGVDPPHVVTIGIILVIEAVLIGFLVDEDETVLSFFYIYFWIFLFEPIHEMILGLKVKIHYRI